LLSFYESFPERLSTKRTIPGLIRLVPGRSRRLDKGDQHGVVAGQGVLVVEQGTQTWRGGGRVIAKDSALKGTRNKWTAST